MAKLKILRGVSGSGKSTFAESQAGNPVIVSRDRIRAGIFGSADQDYYAVPKEVLSRKESLVSKVHDNAIVEALRAGHDVIADNTHTRMKYVNATAALAHKVGAEVEVITFDVPLKTAIERNAMRGKLGGRVVPEDVIRKQHSELAGSKNDQLAQPQVVRPYNGTPGKPKAFLVDIDGTLAHMRDYRGPFDWHKVHLDDVDEVVADAVAYIQSSGMISTIVMSGRDEVCRNETENWLLDHGIYFDKLFMRPEKDMRKDNIVKAELFDAYVRDNFDVQFVLDDRQQVVDMWREMGLTCLQVAPGDF
jgi:predicted kinase